MASPQIENGHIDIANTIADRFCSYRLSGQEWQVIWVILRKTWGWLQNPKYKNGIKKKMDRIALSQFAELTGIDRRKCHVILKKLVTKKVIKKTVTQKGDRIVITYGFQKNFDLWRVSPKKVTVTQKGTKVSPKKAPTKETIQKKEIYSRVINYLNKKTGKNFKVDTKSTQRLIGLRLKDGFSPEDFKTVIDKKCLSWTDDLKYSHFLRPETLFGNKFESYLNELSKTKIKKQKHISNEDILK